MGEAKIALRARALARLNALANHPDIRPHVTAGLTELEVDLSAYFDNPANVTIFEGMGAVLFAAIPGQPDWYDTHYLLLRSPFKDNLASIRKAFHTMFAKENAAVLCGNTPASNRAARLVNRALGCVPHGEGVDSRGRRTIFYVMDRKTWIRATSDLFSPTTLQQAS